MTIQDQVQVLLDQIRGRIKPVGLSPKEGLYAGAFIFGVWFLNYLRKLLSLRRVSVSCFLIGMAGNMLMVVASIWPACDSFRD
jgi:hypothetical protein